MRNDDTDEEIFELLVEDPALHYDPTAYVIEPDTTYFIQYIRDDDAGMLGLGRYTIYVRTGSHEGDLVSTLTQDALTAQLDLRYVFGYIAPGTSWSSTDSGWMQNLDLQEAAAYNIAKIGGVDTSTISKIAGTTIGSSNKLGTVTI